MSIKRILSLIGTQMQPKQSFARFLEYSLHFCSQLQFSPNSRLPMM